MIWTHFVMLAVGLLGGLYWGERGRRLAAERKELTGHASAAPAATVDEGPLSAEERLRNTEDLYRAEPEQFPLDVAAMEEKGTDEMYESARALGRPVSRDDARKQARELINEAMSGN